MRFGKSCLNFAVTEIKQVLNETAKKSDVQELKEVIETPEFTCITNSLPTKDRWSVLHNIPGKETPRNALTPLGTDIDFAELTEIMKEQLRR